MQKRQKTSPTSHHSSSHIPDVLWELVCDFDITCRLILLHLNKYLSVKLGGIVSILNQANKQKYNRLLTKAARYTCFVSQLYPDYAHFPPFIEAELTKELPLLMQLLKEHTCVLAGGYARMTFVKTLNQATSPHFAGTAGTSASDLDLFVPHRR